MTFDLQGRSVPQNRAHTTRQRASGVIEPDLVDAAVTGCPAGSGADQDHRSNGSGSFRLPPAGRLRKRLTDDRWEVVEMFVHHLARANLG